MSFNDIESLLRERLGTGPSRPLPSAGFEDRVHRSLTPRGAGSRRRVIATRTLVGLAAVVAIVAVAVPCLVVRRPGAGQVAGGANSSSSTGVSTVDATATPTLEPTATPAVPLAHAATWQIGFDYPATWTLTDKMPPGGQIGGAPALVGRQAFGFVGSGSATQDCPTWKQGTTPVCTTKWTLPEGSIVIRFAQAPVFAGAGQDPTYTWLGFTALGGPEISSAAKLTVDGMPARYSKNESNAVPYSTETIPGATEVLWWGIPVQNMHWLGYSIVAAIRGPNTDQLEQQAIALVQSIRFDTRPTLLPTDPEALAQARPQALQQWFKTTVTITDDEHNHVYDCFPRTAGASQKASITQTLNSSPMTKPLAVTCTTVSIEPNLMQGWTIILKQTWEAGSGHSAGQMTVLSYAETNGLPTSSAYDGDSYPNVGPSKYKG